MAKLGTTCLMSCSTVANLQSWVGPILQILANAGWIRTSDTGQTELADMPAAAAASTVCGYQVWRMNDSLQSTAPVFVKFEFGSGSAVGNHSLWVTVGTGSDGAGNITGILISQTRIYNNSASASPNKAKEFYGSGDSSRLVFVARSNVNETAFYRMSLSIERTHGPNGSDTADGVMFFAEYGPTRALGTAIIFFVVAVFSGSQPATSTNIGAYVPSGTTWAWDGNIVGVCPVSFFKGGPTNPSKNLMVYLDLDMSAQVPVTIPCYGINLNWMPLGSSIITTVASENASSSLLIRWD